MTPIIPTAQELRDQMPKFDGVTDELAVKQLHEIARKIQNCRSCLYPQTMIQYEADLHPQAVGYLINQGFHIDGNWVWSKADSDNKGREVSTASYRLSGWKTVSWDTEAPEHMSGSFYTRSECEQDAEAQMKIRQAQYDIEFEQFVERVKKDREERLKEQSEKPSLPPSREVQLHNTHGCLPLLLLFALPAVYLLFS